MARASDIAGSDVSARGCARGTCVQEGANDAILEHLDGVKPGGVG